jgi:hypothetical protein
VSLNLHAAVRPAITAINADIPAVILRSGGYVTNASGKMVPRYLQAQNVTIQVQPMSSGDIERANFLNLQGVLRVVYGYGSTEGIIRPSQKGGDLLQFPIYPGEAIGTWLTSTPVEVYASGWSKVFVTLQVDKLQQ